MNEPRGEHRAQVEAALRATAIHSPTSYSWFGAPSPPLAAKVRWALSTAADHEYLHVMLRSQLYTDCFCRGAASPPAAGVVGLPAVEMAAFVEALSAANDGRGRWEDGWEVLAIGDGGVAVRKDGLEVWARREDCRAAGTGAMALGARVCLRLPRESPARSPGYYVALGDAEDVSGTGQTVVRLYWHLTAEGAMPFVRLATAMLNRARLPFTLKVVNHPGRFTRCDAAVVYLARRDFAAAAEVLGELYPEVSGGLRPATPVFTKRLAPGLGLAEDPSEGPSFGLQRCQLLAEGMIRAYEAGARTLDGRMRAVEERFAEAGVNLDEPFLNPGSRDEYAFQMDRPRAVAGRGAGETHYEDTDGGALTTESTERRREGRNGTAEDAEGRGAEPERRRGMKPQGARRTQRDAERERERDGASGREGLTAGGAAVPTPDAAALAEAADAIGWRLGRDAVWHRGRCNWLGVELALGERADAPLGRMYRSLGPTLYAGTSGVALFLAELCTITRDAETRRTALGACRHALAHADTVPAPHRLGLYAGQVGIAFATARVGALLGDDEARERAARLLRRVAQAERGEHELDVISGNAGAIAGLIVLRDLLDDAALVEWAARLGDELVRVAERSAAGWSWRSADFPRQRPLTGFAHGAAGVAYALLELYHATGGAVYRAAAEAAFAYERGWFDVAAGNWPDFRERPGGKSGKQMPHAFAASWCHGAPGIALSRLRAYALLGDDRYRAEALTALRTTYGNVESALASGRDSFSLCHGLAGNAEVLLAGERVLGSECPGGAVLALEVARAGMGAFGKPGLRWDHGGGVGETPGLLLGLAGIGYSYLRLRDPTTPSILLIERDGFGGRGGGEDGTAEGAEDAEEGEDTERGHGVRT